MHEKIKAGEQQVIQGSLDRLDRIHNSLEVTSVGIRQVLLEDTNEAFAAACNTSRPLI